MGLNDYLCKNSDNRFYEKLAERIHNTKKCGFELIFDARESLARVLAVKSDLGLRTREAYKSADKEELKKIICDYDILVERIEEYHTLYQKSWFEFNKPYGFEIQDIRLGGLIQRVKSCRARLEDYINDVISEIPELEEKIPEDESGFTWSRIVSPNVITHIL